MPTLDLDAARAARAEARGEPSTVVFAGRSWVLPAEMTLDASELALTEQVRPFLREMLNGQAEEFLAAKPTTEDLKVLFEWLLATYGGAPVGESAASSSTSSRTSKRSRRPSSANTAST